eukprot:scaffold526_cov356-Prasinococcus_capsulatus_cf.AAC.4
MPQGFEEKDVETALRALPVASATQEQVLDWLCLNLPARKLPTKYRNSRLSAGASSDPKSRAAAKTVKVVNRGAAQASKSPAAGGRAAPSSADEHTKSKQELQRSEDERRKALAIKAKQEKASNKDWILSYVQYESEEETDESDDEPTMWGESLPTKAKKAPKVDPATRLIQIGEELEMAMQHASKAKANGDKGGQSAAGQTIRALKNELAVLGYSESDLPQHKTEIERKSVPMRFDENDLSSLAFAAQDEKDVDRTSGQLETHSDLSTKQDGVEGGVKVEVHDDEDDEDDDILPTFDEFCAEYSGDANDNGISVASSDKITTLPTVAPDGLKLPKALLQSVCQKQVKPSGVPRYQKLEGSQHVFGYRYSVTVPISSSSQAGTKKKGGAGSVATVILKEEHRYLSDHSMDDGQAISELGPVWSTIQEAQNAVALRALFELFRDLLPVHRQLPDGYKQLWHRWEEVEKKQLDAATMAEEKARKSLIENIMGESRSPAGSAQEAVAKEKETSAVNEEDARALSTWKTITQGSAEEARRLQDRYNTTISADSYINMLMQRQKLPIWALREELLALLDTNDVIVLTGETGCGKTTQVPQYILEHMLSCGEGSRCRIVCTQPRRIAAVSVAERVATERAEKGPGNGNSLIGYHVRLDPKYSSSTRLLFCTTGILLRRLQGDPTLSAFSHVVVDEVHERTMQGDFLLIVLKRLVKQRRQWHADGKPDCPGPLKVVLMSATVDADKFARYFGDCPALFAPGRTFPVEASYLEDVYEMLQYNLSPDNPASIRAGSRHAKSSQTMMRTVAGGSNRHARLGSQRAVSDVEQVAGLTLNPHFDEEDFDKARISKGTLASLSRLNEDRIDYDILQELLIHIDEMDRQEKGTRKAEKGSLGSILVFLPGIGEIGSVEQQLQGSYHFRPSANKHLILPLHSSVSSSDQKLVFKRPPTGVRKVILCTNIAETSVTIDDVEFVVDSGRMKEQQYDASRKMSCLVETLVSRANAKQRKGRAGRVGPGKYFALYTSACHSKRMRSYQVPEIGRVPLVELCLQLKVLRFGDVRSFLEEAIEPPKPNAVQSALDTLEEVGALAPLQQVAQSQGVSIDAGEQMLTPLGIHLANFPVDVRIGKLMIYGSVFGCLSSAVTVAACLSYKSPFALSDDSEHRRQLQALTEKIFGSRQQSDHLMMLAAFDAWWNADVNHHRKRQSRQAVNSPASQSAFSVVRQYRLSEQTLILLSEMRAQFAQLLAQNGYVQLSAEDRRDRRCSWLDDRSCDWNKYSMEPSMVKAVLCAGLYPNFAQKNSENASSGLSSTAREYWSDGRSEVSSYCSVGRLSDATAEVLIW